MHMIYYGPQQNLYEMSLFDIQMDHTNIEYLTYMKCTENLDPIQIMFGSQFVHVRLVLDGYLY